MSEKDKRQLQSQTWRRDLDDAEYGGLGLSAMLRTVIKAEEMLAAPVGHVIHNGRAASYRRIK